MRYLRLNVLVLSLVWAGFAVAESSGTKVIGPSASITFEDKKSTLTAESKETLNTLVKEARSKGKVAEVRVAAWSDNPVPRDGENLSKADRDLAKRRSENIRAHLKKALKVDDVDTYNMAERASWLARTLNTKEAQLKEEIGRGGDDPLSRTEFQIFQEKGRPSTAVALVIVERP